MSMIKEWIPCKDRQPEQKWIPVSERLPEKQGRYLVTTKWKGSFSGDIYMDTGIALFWEKTKEWEHKDAVVAWMPLPTQYQSEEDE